MPNITLTWGTRLYVPADVQYGTNDWIYYVQWRRGDNNTQLPTGSGLYIIQNSANMDGTICMLQVSQDNTAPLKVLARSQSFGQRVINTAI
jgi:hypothetical protein